MISRALHQCFYSGVRIDIAGLLPFLVCNDKPLRDPTKSRQGTFHTWSKRTRRRRIELFVLCVLSCPACLKHSMRSCEITG